MFSKFGALGIDVIHKRNTTTKTVDCVFALNKKDSVSDLIKILDKDLQYKTRRGLPLTLTNAANANCFKIVSLDCM